MLDLRIFMLSRGRTLFVLRCCIVDLRNTLGRNIRASMVWYCGMRKKCVQSCLFLVFKKHQAYFRITRTTTYDIFTVTRGCENGGKLVLRWPRRRDKFLFFWKGLILCHADYRIGPIERGIPGATIVVCKPPQQTDNSKYFQDAPPPHFLQSNNRVFFFFRRFRGTTVCRLTKNKRELWCIRLWYSIAEKLLFLCSIAAKTNHCFYENFSKKSNDI